MDLVINAVSIAVGFVFTLTVIVFFHELGHFWVARLFGVRIDAFSIGFGRELFGWYDRKGTRWKVGWLPLGGYVKFWGDENAASLPDREAVERMRAEAGPEAHRNFHLKPVWQRALIVAAGPVANFILAIVIFTALFLTFGQQLLRARVVAVEPGSVAERAGFMPNDVVIRADGEKIRGFSDLKRVVTLGVDKDMTFVVRRGGRDVALQARPERAESRDSFGGTFKGGRLGIYAPPCGGGPLAAKYPCLDGDMTYVRYGIAEVGPAIGAAAAETMRVVKTIFSYLGGIFEGRHSADQLGGPISIANAAGQALQISPYALIALTALLSISIGLLNLFPIPVLDGGHLVYYAYEAAAGHPMSEKLQEFGFRVGLVAVLGLMIFATWNDLSRFGIFDAVRKLFQ